MIFSIIVEYEQHQIHHRSLGMYLIKKIHSEEKEKFEKVRDKMLTIQTANIF